MPVHQWVRRAAVGVAVLLFSFVSAFAADKQPAVAARWTFGKDTAGWQAVRDCKLAVADGVLAIACTGRDPHLVVPVAARDGWYRLTLRAKFQGRLNWQLFWGNEAEDSFSEQRSEQFQSRARDNDWHDYHIFFHTDSDLVRLRLDPGNRKRRVQLAAITLRRQKPPVPVATPVERFKMPPGFQVELLYSVPIREQGSWVSLAVDPKGRLITSDQYGKLYRITPPPLGQPAGTIKIEPIDLEIGMAHGLLVAFDSLYVMANGKGAGLYRVLDTDGDDQYDTVKKLRAVPGAGEHGPHAVILAPDGKSLYVCAGNHTNLPAIEKSVVPRNWQEDILHDRLWDAGGHAVGRMAPGGWIARINPDGSEWELVSVGYRNEFDLAFNGDGELFTFDADMEWDINTPWYRPTRVCHVTSGSEFGWRSGTGKWPKWYPDSLPAVVDIGPGSPTGIGFGYGAKFPAKYQRALFVADWSFGIIFAVHLEPSGSSYRGTAERFITAAPLPVTDLVVNPVDGAMYFTIGGRRTQSGLYRVTYTGNESIRPDDGRSKAGARLRTRRRRLEAMHRPGSPEVIERAWRDLSHQDRHIRFAARVAVEHQPVERWQERALAERDPLALVTASIALARNGDASLKPRLIAALGRLKIKRLSEEQQLGLLRAYGLVSLRMGKPEGKQRAAIVKHVDALYPNVSPRLNRELCQLLAWLEAPGVVPRTLSLLKAASTQEEQMHYVLVLRKLKDGWTRDQRRSYFEWFNRAAAHRGGHSFAGFIQNIRNEAVEMLPDEEKQALAKTLAAIAQPLSAAPDTIPRKFVRKWTTDELLPALEDGLSSRDYRRGRQLFAAVSCYKCHRFAGEGGIIGPDLTAAVRRFNNRDLLDSMTRPSRTISDQYQATMFVLESGKTVVGRVANLGGENIMVIENMFEPGKLTAVRRNEIEEVLPSKTSMMPDGLINTLTRDEILDLVAFIRSGGDPGDAVFKKK